MKYKLEQTIWYMKGNKPHSAKVLSFKTVEALHTDASTPEQKEIFTPFGSTGTFYGTCHGVFEECDCFASKDELLKSL
jgi:hypothetical protein